MQNNNYPQSTETHKQNSVTIVLGLLFILTGVLMLLAVMNISDFILFRLLDILASGLAGSLKIFFPLFLIWGGIIMVFSNRFNTFKLAYFLLLLLFFEVLSIINIGSTIKTVQTNETLHLLDYVSYLNGDVHKKPDFFKYFSTLFQITSNDPYYAKVGGALGMIFAWPLWYYFESVLATVLISIITFITLSLFIKFIVLDKINNKSRRFTQEELYQIQYQEYLRQYYQNNQNYYYPNQADGYDSSFKVSQANLLFENKVQAPQEIATPTNGDELNRNFYTPDEEPISIKNPLPKGTRKNRKKTLKEEIDKQNTAQFDEKYNFSSNNVKHTNTPRVINEQSKENIILNSPKVEDVQTNFNSLNAYMKPKESGIKQSEKRESLQIPTESMQAYPIPNQEEFYSKEISKPSEKQIDRADFTPNIVQDNSSFGLHVSEQQKPSVFIPPTTPTNIFGGMHTGKRLDNLVPNLEKPQKKQDYHDKTTPQYIYPKSTLLENPSSLTDIDPAYDMERAKLLEDTLESFGITTTVANVTHGPAVTRFELDLASGINVKRINNVADNIALNMSAESGVRIEAPIPGTTFVGIEIPNKKITPVSFKEVMYSREMLAEKDPLAIALGKDISGRPIICNLAQMPHLLIAGATGSGKSVCINAIITSIIFRCSPEDCRLILIDPKMVELQRYNVLPHLLIPVVCEPHKASGALSWALAEMTDRYNRFKDCAVSNIQTYNSNLPPGAKKLPRIVVVVDELADLMISSSRKEIEHDINRIAALARAAGIHLVVATQRPSVDVITGVIKANLLSRIAFLSSSATDSRTILDRSGAENLVGNGDMLYMPSGFKNPLRVQGCFLKNNEINTVLDYIRNNSTTNFDVDAIEAIENTGEDDKMPMEDDSNKVDPLLEEAIDMVISDGQASISMLQRRMSIGYARAGRLIDAMTKRGVISKSAGSKPREVLVSRAEYEQIRDEL